MTGGTIFGYLCPKQKKSAMTKYIILSFLLLSLPFSACEKNNPDDIPGDPIPIELSMIEELLIESDNEFSFDIFKLIMQEESAIENIMISPLSISYALSMTMNGANGATRDSMMKALRYYDISLDDINNSYLELSKKLMNIDERVIMEIANSVWVEDRLTVKQDFINDLQNYFDAEARNFSVSDPEIKNIINQWIEDHTNGKIREMIDEIPADIAMILINAIYFNGKWKYKFDEDNTLDKPFYKQDGQQVTVDMMSQETNIKVGTDSKFLLAEMPYGQGNFVMDIILPNDGYSTEDILHELNSDNWNTLIASMNETKVQLNMPRFKYEYKISLKDILCSMGMGLAFSGNADFSNISDQALAISKVLHQTFIETKEEGTEAAAATVVMIEFTSVVPSEPLQINLNKPFLYVIRESMTNTIVFMGKTGNPSV